MGEPHTGAREGMTETTRLHAMYACAAGREKAENSKVSCIWEKRRSVEEVF